MIAGDWHDLASHAPFDLLFADGGRAKEREPEIVVVMPVPGGLLVLDDLWIEGRWDPSERLASRGDPVRDFWLRDRRLAAVELLVRQDHAVILAVRRRAVPSVDGGCKATNGSSSTDHGGPGLDTALIYNASKFLHIFLAIVAVGFNASYGIWLARAARDPEHLPHVLRGIKLLDDRFANPAYVLLLVTGIVTAAIGGIPFTTLWIAAAIALWVVLAVVGLAVYTPSLRGQLEALEADGPSSDEYQRHARRGRVAGIVLAVIALAIVALMVFKPSGRVF